jgi:NAD(P)H-dependent FMN reductase
MLNLIAISGSLRQASSNTALLQAAIALAPQGVTITRYLGVGDLPMFSPDLEDNPPPSVQQFRAACIAADGVILSSPEYAHGIVGSFKNALDWLVGSFDLAGKPVALLNASDRAQHAYATLNEIIMTMGWIIIPEASLRIPVSSKESDPAVLLAQPETVALLHQAIDALTQAITRIAAEQ